jgi:hypothetical protein
MKRSDLHAYQNYCVEFLKAHPEAMLILEMGLGKSCISLTAILDLMFDSFEDAERDMIKRGCGSDFEVVEV